MYYAIIMAGGQGTRLWPISRKNTPKQLQSFIGRNTLIQETVKHLEGVFDFKNIFVSTTPEYLRSIQEQVPKVPKENYIVEPMALGNAAACGLVTAYIHAKDPQADIIFLPADHAITDKKIFKKCLHRTKGLIERHSDKIIMLGVKPTHPDTGLGYIKKNNLVEEDSGNYLVYKVDKFVEKPDRKTAEKYLKTGNYLWNIGIYIWNAETFLTLYKKYLNNNYKIVSKIVSFINAPKYEKVLHSEYKNVDNISIDYGLTEKIKNILVMSCDFNWSDIGSWGSLFEILKKANSNGIISKGHHLSIDDENALVFARDKLVATIGLKDVVVIDTDDAILICNRHKAHQVKDLLNKLRETGKDNYL